MKYRKLRIAWSVAWGVACLLLVVLWVRSYWWHDIVACRFTSKDGIRIDSTNGGLTLAHISLHGFPITFVDWKVTSIWSPSQGLFPIGFTEESYAGFYLEQFTDGFALSVPYWFLVPLSAAFGTLAYVSRLRRFSLRTLLIAMTAAAIGLGLAVYALKK